MLMHLFINVHILQGSKDMTYRKKLSIEALKVQKEGFANVVQQIKRGELEVVTREPTQQDRLEVFKEEIKALKGLPYSTLVLLLKEHTGLKVSEQSLRTFCQTRLNWPKRSERTPTNKGSGAQDRPHQADETKQEGATVLKP